MADMWMPEMNGGELVKAIRERFLAASTRQAACAALPKLSDADMKSVTESCPPAYDRMLGDKSATNEDGTRGADL